MEATEPKKAPNSLEIGLPPASPDRPSPLRKMILVASIAAGIQFGWALQLSLLTPYVQLLGVPHFWSSFIWLCGPISGMLVQPTVGYYSDRCTSPFGRRRPFITAGAGLVAVAALLIGFAADMGRVFGDNPHKAPKPRAIAAFVVGFWILDVANNMLQGPCRALLADLSASDSAKTRTSFAFFSFFMAVGNVLGYAAGSYSKLYKILPFTKTDACDIYCANLKSCFFISIALLLTLTLLATFLVTEKRFTLTDLKDAAADDTENPVMCARLPFFGEIIGALKDLKRPMWILMLVTALNWVAWFPFFLYDTDWMGKEIFGGEVGDKNYGKGVNAGSLGLMLQSVVLGIMSLAVEPLSRLVGGAKRLWGIVNVVLAICLGLMVVATKMAQHARHDAFLAGATATPVPPENVKVFALALFALLGIPLAITFSIPFALASIFSTSSGAGQGLSLGVLNLAIVVPQMFVSVTSGPWDKLFGGGNLPAFVVGALAAVVSSVLSFTLLPSPPGDVKFSGAAVGGH